MELNWTNININNNNNNNNNNNSNSGSNGNGWGREGMQSTDMHITLVIAIWH